MPSLRVTAPEAVQLTASRFVRPGFLALACILLFSLTSPARPQADDWTVATDANFSFEYPAGWQIRKIAHDQVTQINAIGPDGHSVTVRFEAGLVNRPGILNQCETVDAYLETVYRSVYAPLDTGTNQYPYTTVTKDGFQPATLGGESTSVSS